MAICLFVVGKKDNWVNERNATQLIYHNSTRKYLNLMTLTPSESAAAGTAQLLPCGLLRISNNT